MFTFVSFEQSKNIYGSYCTDGQTDRQTEVINTFQLSLEVLKTERFPETNVKE